MEASPSYFKQGDMEDIMDVCKCRQMKAICYLPYPLCHLIRSKVACWKLGRKRRRTQSPTWNSLLVLLRSAYIFILSWVLRIWSLSTRRTASRSYSNSSTACTLAVLGYAATESEEAFHYTTSYGVKPGVERHVVLCQSWASFGL